MNLQNNYYFFEGAIPSKFSDDLIKFGENELNINTALIDDMGEKPNNEKDLAKLYKTRNSSVAWIDLQKEKWVWKMINPFFHIANQEANWNFDLEFPENAQWTQYSNTQHYSWHQDAFSKSYNSPTNKMHGLIRKLSATIVLDDGESYEGGDLEFKIHKSNESIIEFSKKLRTKGTITIFPSFVWHRVKPVVKGTRRSLVIWYLGKPYR